MVSRIWYCHKWPSLVAQALLFLPYVYNHAGASVRALEQVVVLGFQAVFSRRKFAGAELASCSPQYALADFTDIAPAVWRGSRPADCRRETEIFQDRNFERWIQ